MGFECWFMPACQPSADSWFAFSVAPISVGFRMATNCKLTEVVSTGNGGLSSSRQCSRRHSDLKTLEREQSGTAMQRT